jgi:hypothetical protein
MARRFEKGREVLSNAPNSYLARERSMTNENPQDKPPKNPPPVLLVPRSLIYAVVAIVVGSFVITQFVHNPYTAATQNDFGERGPFDGLPLWVAIFVGIPAAYFAYTKWIAPLLKGK